MLVSESLYNEHVKTLIVKSVRYKYYDITAIEQNYGMFFQLLTVAIIAINSQDVSRLLRAHGTANVLLEDEQRW